MKDILIPNVTKARGRAIENKRIVKIRNRNLSINLKLEASS
jgi:hypothetical protein